MPDPRPAATSHHVHRVQQAVVLHELSCWGLNEEVKPPILTPIFQFYGAAFYC
jgi:hypothetical protein